MDDEIVTLGETGVEKWNVKRSLSWVLFGEANAVRIVWKRHRLGRAKRMRKKRDGIGQDCGTAER